MKKLFFLYCLVAGLFGCTKNESKQKVADVMLTKPVVVNDEKASANSSALYKTTTNGSKALLNAPTTITRKIIKEGEISFETKNIADTRKAIYNSLQKLGGYIAAENESNDSSDSRKMYMLKARIPANNFEEFLEGVSSDATKIYSKNIRATDVTSDYIDYTAQITNEKKLEERYLELLKKGTKMSDLLDIEDKITGIQTAIDSTQGHLNYLLRQVDYSSLNITFYTGPVIKDNAPTFGAKLVSALSGGWGTLLEMFFALAAIWPLWLIGAIAWFVFKTWRRKNVVTGMSK